MSDKELDKRFDLLGEALADSDTTLSMSDGVIRIRGLGEDGTDQLIVVRFPEDS